MSGELGQVEVVKESARSALANYSGELPVGAKAFAEYALGIRRMAAAADMGRLARPGEAPDYFQYLRSTALLAVYGNPEAALRLMRDEQLLALILEADTTLFEGGVV